jgi:carbon-monoxide dehydrogenase medium subunit
MYPYPFDYHRPSSVTEALAMLGEYGDEGKLLAGGHSLLPVLKLRLAQPAHLIDITGLGELRGVRRNGESVEIGALTTHHDILVSDELKQAVGLLPEMANVIGDQQVRNRGTIGGTLAHADPAADYPAGILALNAEISTIGPSGQRTISSSDFFVGFLTTALEPDEIVTAVTIPVLQANTGYRYEKLANPASGYAIAGVAAIVTLKDDGTIKEARVGITGASEKAWRATAVEQALVGSTGDEAAIKSAADLAIDGQEMLEDIHAPASYRERVTRNLVRRAVAAAANRARG